VLGIFHPIPLSVYLDTPRKEYKLGLLPHIIRSDVDCLGIFSGDQDVIEAAKNMTDKNVTELASDCVQFKKIIILLRIIIYNILRASRHWSVIIYDERCGLPLTITL
jgi:hypothetical protein